MLCSLDSTSSVSFCLTNFFFNDTAATEIYTLSLHDALPISIMGAFGVPQQKFKRHRLGKFGGCAKAPVFCVEADRKSTRLNSSHQISSYAVFCLEKEIKVCNLVLVCVSMEAGDGRACWLLLGS
mgnify:CR=1 FL=1